MTYLIFFDSLMQKRHKSGALAMDSRLFCIKPSMYLPILHLSFSVTQLTPETSYHDPTIRKVTLNDMGIKTHLSPWISNDINKCYKSGSCERWQTLVLWCIWGLFVNKSTEKIHITNILQIQLNTTKCTRSFYIAHTLIYSPFIHSFMHSFIHSFISPFIHSFIHSHNTSHHSCITHASPIHHTLNQTMHHPFIRLPNKTVCIFCGILYNYNYHHTLPSF